MHRETVYGVLDCLANGLKENPDAIPGVDGLVVADWLERVYFDQDNNAMIFNRNDNLKCTREESEVVMGLKKRGISAESFNKMIPLLLLIQEKNLNPDAVLSVLKQHNLMKREGKGSNA